MLNSETEPASFPVVIAWPARERLLVYLQWAACALAVVAAAAALLLPLGSGHNRLTGAVAPFAAAGAACAALALWPKLDRVLSLFLYGVALIALTYGLMVVGSLPLRLTVIGTCPAGSLPCPPGFEPDMTGGETLGMEVALALGILALLAAVAAMEVRYRPRLRIIGRGTGQQPAQAAPPPEMRPSAIPKRPAAEPVNQGSGTDTHD
jgi:hypothetical protein